MPKPPTLREQYSEGLEKLGCKKVASKSGKYEVYEAPEGRGFYFLGKSGAVRVARTNSATASVFVPDRVRDMILAARVPGREPGALPRLKEKGK